MKPNRVVILFLLYSNSFAFCLNEFLLIDTEIQLQEIHRIIEASHSCHLNYFTVNIRDIS